MSAAAMLVIAPILRHVVQDFGMDPVQFGVMLSFNLLIGTMPPPVGAGLFVGARVAGIRPEQGLRAVRPSDLPLAGRMVIALVPVMATGLPKRVFGR